MAVQASAGEQDAAAGAAAGQDSIEGQDQDLDAALDEFDAFGEWRFLYSHSQGFPLNAAGTQSGLGWFLDQRLDVGSTQTLGEHLRFTGELEIFYGQVAGDADHVGAAYRPDARETLRGWSFKNWDLKQLWLKWDLPWFQVRAGQMGSHWGLGLLAHDGRTEEDRFGWPDQSDLSDRLVLATRPFATLYPDGWAGKIAVALGGGLVYRDENASLRRGDLGGEVLLSVFFEDQEDMLGMYAAGRFQKDEAGTRLDVAVVDLSGRLAPPVGHSGPCLAAEAVLLAGRTNRVLPVDHPDGAKVLAFGAVARAGWRFAGLGLTPQIEIGYAGGDANPHDDQVTTFFFDPSFRVGLVLFDVVLRDVSAMEAQEAADPARVGTPMPGVNQLPSAGRVSNAVYLFPTVRYQPLEHLNLLAGLLFAFSSAPFSQSYQSFKNGGVAANPYGRTSPDRNLGLEFDLGADWDQPLAWGLHLKAGLQAGWFFPGAAFGRPDGTRPGIIARVLARLALAW